MINLRSRAWFDNPANPGMTALYLERTMNYELTRDEQAPWLTRSVEFSFERSCGVVSLIPTRLGNGALEGVRWRNSATDEVEERPVCHVFCMMGADPSTGWLRDCVALDEKGFVVTGQDIPAEELATSGWSLSRHPLLLETSRPGIFAVGDVRSGNVKRVASAVGEGSISIQLVHRVLAG